ncbi:MAG: penicillin-binding transpeptidase domain-containing protein, partial [Victivallaceae bacterium]
LSVIDVVKKSSNIGTAKVALELGKYRLNLGLRKFGIGERTGLPFKNEVRGRLALPTKWDGVQITRVGIGYSVNVTPVQMVRAYCALANNGLLPKLRIVDHLEDPESGDIIPNPYEAPYQVFQKPDTCKKIVQMLIGVTEKGGTGTKAAVPGYNVAAKTGTSFKYDEQARRYNKEKYHASIVGFVPAENPSFVLLIMVDGPKGKRSHGGTVAGPYFKAIATRTLQYLQVKPFSPVNGRISSGSNDFNDYEQEYGIGREEYMPPDEQHETETDDTPNTLGLPPGPDGVMQPAEKVKQQ